MLTTMHLKEALRFAKNSFKKQTKFNGNAKQICKQITKQCWNNTYFQTSLNNYPGFYNRDFGICCKALIKLGYKDEVLKTLIYALEIFRKNDKVSTNITKENILIDCFSHTPESLSFMLNNLTLLNNKQLINEYQDFLEQQAQYIFDNDFDTKLGLLRKDKTFSKMKDNIITQSSCYNNCMLAMLSNNLNKLKLNNPFKNHDLKKVIKKHFWKNGFIDDLSNDATYTGDANTFPYWTNVFDNKKMFKTSLDKIKELGLDQPFPLKYTNTRNKQKELKPMRYFIPGWQSNTIWCHLGMCFLDIVKKYDKKLLKQYLDQYKAVIETNQNFLEVFNSDGTPYNKLFYKSDSGMLWACKYMNLIN